MADIIFPDGMSFMEPSQKAPEWAKGTVSFNVGKFIEWADKHQVEGWLKVDIRESKKGKLYLCLNQYRKPGAAQAPGVTAAPREDIPVIQVEREDASNYGDIPF